jgi:hypothetical protein
MSRNPHSPRERYNHREYFARAFLPHVGRAHSYSISTLKGWLEYETCRDAEIAELDLKSLSL